MTKISNVYYLCTVYKNILWNLIKLVNQLIYQE